MRTICIIQARQGSSRLPGKSLRPLQGRPLIAHVIERAQALPVDGVVLATSVLPADDILVDRIGAQYASVPVIRGPETDVLTRIAVAAQLCHAEAIVRITGDCPLLAVDVGHRVIGDFLMMQRATNVEYCWNDTSASGFPDGTDIEVFTMGALEQANRYARRFDDREHVTPWIRRNVVSATVTNANEDLSALKLSVDTVADFERVAAILAHVPRGHYDLADTVQAARAAGVCAYV